jgi:anti-sigma factor RsiW
MTYRPFETDALDHPPLEDLAAFIDGALGEEECARMQAHLARCEECYELFTETVRFQQEEAGEGEAVAGEEEKGAGREDAGEEAEVLPFRERAPVPERAREHPPKEHPQKKHLQKEPPRRERSRFRLGWAAAAAVAVLALAVGPLVYRRVAPGSGPAAPQGSEALQEDPGLRTAGPGEHPPEPREPSGAELVAALPASEAPALAANLWPRARRGESDEVLSFEAQSFRLGVEAVNLQVSIAAGDRETLREVTARLGVALAEFPGVDEALAHRFEDLADSGPGRPLAELGLKASAAEESLEEGVPVLDSRFLAFGRWASAGRLAALSGKPGLLEGDEVRRFFARLREEEVERLEQDGVDDEVEQIEQVLGQGELGAAERERLVALFEQILAAYYGA